MAEAHSSASAASPSLPEAGIRRRSTTTIPKLRDCCIGCATSKVRCSREKPACSRCAKRKMKCEYLASKRAGRRHDSSDKAQLPVNMADNSDVFVSDAERLSAPRLDTSALAADPDTLMRLLIQLASCASAPTGKSTGLPAANTSFQAQRSDTTLSQPPAAPEDVLAHEMAMSASDSPLPPNWPQPQQQQQQQQQQQAGAKHSAAQHVIFPTETPNIDARLVSTHGQGGSEMESFDVDTDMDLDMNLGDDFMFDVGDDLPSGFPLSPGSLFPTAEPSGEGSNGGVRNDQHSSAAPTGRSSRVGLDSEAAHVVSGVQHGSCLTKAADLMQHLFLNPPASCKTAAEEGRSGEPSLPSIATVVGRNRQTIEAIRTMLTCPCSSDAHLLAMMAHTVLKLLGWYSVAVKQSSTSSASSVTAMTPESFPGDGSVRCSNDSSKDSTTASGDCSRPSLATRKTAKSTYEERVSWEAQRIGKYRLEGDDAGRMTAQLVLSEMHRVQSVVRELAGRLNAKHGSNGEGGEEGFNGDEAHAPFSSEILIMLGADLKRQLRRLKNEIIEILRSF